MRVVKIENNIACTEHHNRTYPQSCIFFPIYVRNILRSSILAVATADEIEIWILDMSFSISFVMVNIFALRFMFACSRSILDFQYPDFVMNNSLSSWLLH